MICPYLKKVIHVPAYITGKNVTGYAEDVAQFRECVKEECPFYYTDEAIEVVEHCRRAESEVSR